MWSYHLLLQNDLITSVDNLKKNVRYDGEGEGESLDSGRQREEVFLKKLTKLALQISHIGKNMRYLK